MVFRWPRNCFNRPCNIINFGGKKIPELMRGLGKGISQFKKGMKEVDDEINTTLSDNDKK